VLPAGTWRLRAGRLRLRLWDRSILQPAGLQPALVRRVIPWLQSLLLWLLLACLLGFQPELLRLARSVQPGVSRPVLLPVCRPAFTVLGLPSASGRAWVCLPKRGLLAGRLRQSLSRRIVCERDAGRRW
jgi:hypothetical protein